MNTRTGFFVALGIGTLLVLALAVGGSLLSTAYAQEPWQEPNWGGMHNNQAVLALLKTNESELLQQRQQGKSWLDIATAQGVSEQELSRVLLQPMAQMHGWMTQNYPQSSASQMTDWMRQQLAQDIRTTRFGAMTDMHLFGDGMMGNWNGYDSYGGMMWGYGMMGRGMMGGGIMGGWNNTPNVNATPVPSTQKVDREIQLTARNFQFDPTRVETKKGERIKFNITNQDNFAHNAGSQNGKLAYTVLPAHQMTSITWIAPTQAGTYTVICTWHPGMQFQIGVE